MKNIFKDSESLLNFIILIALTFIFAYLVGRYLQKRIEGKGNRHNIDVTSFVFLKHMIVAII
jgi:hypothetical protein